MKLKPDSLDPVELDAADLVDDEEPEPRPAQPAAPELPEFVICLVMAPWRCAEFELIPGSRVCLTRKSYLAALADGAVEPSA